MNPCTRICSPLPRLSATPPDGGLTLPKWVGETFLRADDEIRTRDPHLGKVMLYQLSHVRIALPVPGFPGSFGALRTLAQDFDACQIRGSAGAF